MIVRKKPGILALFFVVRGSVIQRVWPQALGVGVMSAVIVAMHRDVPQVVPGLSSAPFALMGIALSIFLSFRNSASYDRWWEGRKLWGQIIQTARDMARQTAVLGEGAERRTLLMAVVTFATRAKAQLRGAATPDEATADMALADAERVISDLERAGRLTLSEALVARESLLRFAQSLVACERLANTPLPFAYTLLLHRTAYIFCFVMPFGFADTLGWLTPIATALVGYTFFGLDALAEELEEPFGTRPNALPLDAYATAVEIAMRRALGETDLPVMPEPVHYVLS